MRIVFRVDASTQIGSGHVMRCLTLADGLRAGGAQVCFVCRELNGNLFQFIQSKGYKVCALPPPDSRLPPLTWNRHAHWLEVDWERDAKETLQILQGEDGKNDWLIVDHYALDQRWESRLRQHATRIMVVDDLADRVHDCDLLLDQNFYEAFEGRYKNLVPFGCLKLLGPRYALLRQEFSDKRAFLRLRNGTINRILVFLGGSDSCNVTEKAVLALKSINEKKERVRADIVVGGINPHQERIRQLCLSLPWATCHCQVDYMAELIASADLAIGAGGSTTWERCCLGLPSLVLVMAENQAAMVSHCASQGIISNLGNPDMISPEDIRSAIEIIMSSPDEVFSLSRRSAELVDGFGLQRVVAKMLA
jgi:UDP-2,4-diacetamido-2,4,6-trideoxy-beta-L-altropyranose hydrolase